MKEIKLVLRSGRSVRLPCESVPKFIAKDNRCFMYEGVDKEMTPQYRQIDLSLKWLDKDAKDFIRNHVK